MKTLGLDLATVSGWALLENDKLIERGTIQLLPSTNLPQKLNYFQIELKNLFTRLQPDWCCIEDVILGISGAKTLAFLARLNGVAISTASSVLLDNVKLYSPNYWKSHSFPGLSGMAKKWEVQLTVINHFNIPVIGNFDEISEISNFCNTQNIERTKVLNEKKEIRNNLLKLTTRKKNPVTGATKDTMIANISNLNLEINGIKSEIKSIQIKLDKQMSKMVTNIASQTGITDNIADACGIAYCGYKEITNAN